MRISLAQRETSHAEIMPRDILQEICTEILPRAKGPLFLGILFQGFPGKKNYRTSGQQTFYRDPASKSRQEFIVILDASVGKTALLLTNSWRLWANMFFLHFAGRDFAWTAGTCSGDFVRQSCCDTFHGNLEKNAYKSVAGILRLLFQNGAKKTVRRSYQNFNENNYPKNVTLQGNRGDLATRPVIKNCSQTIFEIYFVQESRQTLPVETCCETVNKTLTLNLHAGWQPLWAQGLVKQIPCVESFSVTIKTDKTHFCLIKSDLLMLRSIFCMFFWRVLLQLAHTLHATL